MKKLTLILFVTLFTIIAFAQKPNYKVFPFKSGIIEYEYAGKTKGTHIKYIDDYGYKQADETNSVTKILGQKTIENSTDILIGSVIYSIDYKDNTLIKVKNPVYETYANASGDYEELGKQAMDVLGFKNTGETGTVLGKECEIWKGPLGEVWVWKNLALKTKTKILGIKIEETAVNINLNSSIPSGKFEVPSNLEVQEMDDMVGGQSAESDEPTVEDVKNTIKSLFGKKSRN
ncbi:MAG: hypothetical protein ABFR05_01545 [Bacteroidota bacterium]